MLQSTTPGQTEREKGEYNVAIRIPNIVFSKNLQAIGLVRLVHACGCVESLN
jgi:hypothetical protein